MTRLAKIPGGSNKYSAKRTWSNLCKRYFASKAEAARGDELMLLWKAGEIHYLEFQKRFVLCKDPRISITIDFAYVQGETLEQIYEDVKGLLTRDFRTKMAWTKEKHGIDIILSKSGG